MKVHMIDYLTVMASQSDYYPKVHGHMPPRKQAGLLDWLHQ